MDKKMINIAVIGAGNISNTRHIPALKKIKKAKIYGVVGVKSVNIDRTIRKHHIEKKLVVGEEGFIKAFEKCNWFKHVDAVVIGIPPREHFEVVKAALLQGKHVLIEKPMTMNTMEAKELNELAKKNKKILCVMHNFQFTNGIKKLEKMVEDNRLGDIVSFDEFQLTNKNRRLPEWYNDLPLGLFYDEAPHFMYLLEKFGGKLSIDNAYCYKSKIKGDNTPVLLDVSLRAGDYPAHIFLNFESPICEWYFVVSGSKKIAFYDLFKDILIVLPSDNEHYAIDILKNSASTTFQYWRGFFANGIRMISGNLLYGHDVILSRFIESIENGTPIDASIDGHSGGRTVQYMQDIIDSLK